MCCNDNPGANIGCCPDTLAQPMPPERDSRTAIKHLGEWSARQFDYAKPDSKEMELAASIAVVLADLAAAKQEIKQLDHSREVYFDAAEEERLRANAAEQGLLAMTEERNLHRNIVSIAARYKEAAEQRASDAETLAMQFHGAIHGREGPTRCSQCDAAEALLASTKSQDSVQ